MNEYAALRREIELVTNGLNELLQSLQRKRPVSLTIIKGVIEDIQVHASAALFQLDCVDGSTTAFHQSLPSG